MDFKKIILVFSMVVMFCCLITVSATTQNTHDIQSILQDYTESDMIGCCSIALQQDGNNSIMAFRRDSDSAADIYIEKINWHGKDAIRQYKTTNGYFCQVIVTSDGWTIGYGGIDDGVDNEKIENITGKALENNTKNVIPESLLSQVSQIKAAYGLGHMLIKAPDGTYGVATANNYFTGKLNPNEYISVPNKDGFIRTGSIDANTSDKVSSMISLEQSDGFGLTRRDITTFVFTCGNDTENVTNVYLSNDDGAVWGMGTSGLVDNVNFLGNVTQAGDIPIAPSYKHLGNVTFEKNETTSSTGANDIIFNMIIYSIVLIFIVVVAFFAYHIVRVIRYRNRYKR